MRERDIEKYLVEQVKAFGGEVRKVKWIGRRGAPDRVVMLPGNRYTVSVKFDDRTDTLSGRLNNGAVIWVELKAPGKKAEPHQLREHQRMQAMGQRVVVIDSLRGVDDLLR